MRYSVELGCGHIRGSVSDYREPRPCPACSKSVGRRVKSKPVRWRHASDSHWHELGNHDLTDPPDVVRQRSIVRAKRIAGGGEDTTPGRSD